MYFCDLALSRRLERAEAHSCAQYAITRRRLFPESRADVLESAGVVAVFDGIRSPITQAFALGLFEEVSPDVLHVVGQFFNERGAPASYEVSPFAGASALAILCEHEYRPVEVSNVLHRPIEPIPVEASRASIDVRIAEAGDEDLWRHLSARGWSLEHPELHEVLSNLALISLAAEELHCFIGEHDGTPGATGMLCIHEGVALLGGSSTVPELRRRGLQSSLLQARIAYAKSQGCDIAMMVAEPGSDAQRNAERVGFQIAYTRTKWQAGE